MGETIRAIGPDGSPVDPAELAKKLQEQAEARQTEAATQEMPAANVTEPTPEVTGHVREMQARGARDANPNMDAIDVSAAMEQAVREQEEADRRAEDRERARLEALAAARGEAPPVVSNPVQEIDIDAVRAAREAANNEGGMDDFFTAENPDLDDAA